MKTLHISERLSLPLDWITLATVVYGARGSGKTSFGRVAAEEATKARQRFCAIDLKGDWFGLKSSADGKSDGIPVVVFGGDHEDVPLEDGAGAFVGETVAGLEQSCILDFENFSKGKRTRFLAEFFEVLYHRNREPLLLLLDEAQAYAPQKPGPDEARTLGAVQDLVKLGRKHGIGPVLFTQRGAGLSKEVSELCDLLVAFRTPGPLDQDRIEGWLNANTTAAQCKEVMGKLSSLPTGTAVFASGHPDLTTFGVFPVRRPETFDSSATPKVGERKREPKKLATPDLDALRGKMAAAIERRKADDPKALREQLRRVTSERDELAARLEGAVAPGPAEIVEVSAFDLAAFGALHEAILQEFHALKRAADEAEKRAHRLLEGYENPFRDGVRSPKVHPSAPKPRPAVTATSIVHRDPKPGNSAPRKKTTLDTRILTVLAQHRGAASRDRLALHLGVHPRAKGFSNAISALRSAGYVEDYEITSAGLAHLGPFERLPTGSALLEWWCREKLAPAEARILTALAERDDWTRDSLAAHLEVHPRAKGYANTISKLRGLSLVDGYRLSGDLADG